MNQFARQLPIRAIVTERHANVAFIGNARELIAKDAARKASFWYKLTNAIKIED